MPDRLARAQNRVGAIYCLVLLTAGGDDCPLGLPERAAAAKLTSSGKRRLKTLLYYRPGK
jgi:hypothetical protein